jgi:5'-nucleotidase
MAKSTFPWLLANIIEKESGLPLAGAAPTTIIDHGGVKVGVVGLAEQEWIATLVTVNEDQLDYEVGWCRLTL